MRPRRRKLVIISSTKKFPARNFAKRRTLSDTTKIQSWLCEVFLPVPILDPKVTNHFRHLFDKVVIKNSSL